MNIEQIITSSGGPERIATEAGLRGIKLSSWGVYKWRSNGIPEKHWPLIKDLSGASVEEIFNANAALKAPAVASC